MMSLEIADMHCLSDEYLAEDLKLELQEMNKKSTPFPKG